MKSMCLQSPAPMSFKKMDSRTQSRLKIIFPTLIINCMRTGRIQLHMALHILNPSFSFLPNDPGLYLD